MRKDALPMSLDTECDGRALAVRLLEELEIEGAADRCSIDPCFRAPGAKQDIPLVRYLQILHERKNPDLDRGFCAVLTDFVACCLDGAIPDSRFYRQFVAASDRRFQGFMSGLRAKK